MLFAPIPAALTLRAEGDGSRVISGSFPYNSLATLSDGGRNGGRPRKERFKSRAFAYRVDKPDEEIHLLFGHDFDKPMASKLSKTLSLTDSAAALSFEARITPEVAETSYVRDALALIAAGLAVGLSPGFRIPPQRTVPDAETVEDEDPSLGDAIIRTINAALLYELSIVTRPAYQDSEVEARSWNRIPMGVMLPRRLLY
ncbi:HK97 family phage prohead protease [Pusillimonas noertemannii]|uniref:Prohead serine protease domain-containing protein n=1 Tax=Pusillimonas noertemannii TaxID=305977 RepID=A0A2U1CR79_9BURK|nr:HK97 family phage prohead protease [Pusillimonas noertemannii]NYT67708.1 HK97 family phage prohead protease [Pusillimonas noertemannii]PVY68379.1 hypothetical protein C7440_0776 [Pusillimonas noertemannii]TFL12136.1 hypothetical protein CSC72_03170 [Pusillimonas noertemannii]